MSNLGFIKFSKADFAYWLFWGILILFSSISFYYSVMSQGDWVGVCIAVSMELLKVKALLWAFELLFSGQGFIRPLTFVLMVLVFGVSGVAYYFSVQNANNYSHSTGNTIKQAAMITKTESKELAAITTEINNLTTKDCPRWKGTLTPEGIQCANAINRQKDKLLEQRAAIMQAESKTDSLRQALTFEGASQRQQNIALTGGISEIIVFVCCLIIVLIQCNKNVLDAKISEPKKERTTQTKNQESLNCKECDTPFIPNSPHQKFCSAKCRKSHFKTVHKEAVS